MSESFHKSVRLVNNFYKDCDIYYPSPARRWCWLNEMYDMKLNSTPVITYYNPFKLYL